jgi:hypothetical protein
MARGRCDFESKAIAYLGLLIPVAIWNGGRMFDAIKAFDPFVERPPMSDAMRKNLVGWEKDKWRGAVRSANAHQGR